MTVHELDVSFPATTVQTVNFTKINASSSPGTVQPLSLVPSGPQTVNLSPVVNATPDEGEV